jgi:cytochrome c-type biogenesis protein
LWGAFALGIPFSIAICPFCTPILIVLLGVVADLGSPWLGGGLLLAFALGRAIPVVLGAGAVGWFEHLKPLAATQHWFNIAGGLVLIVAGLYLLNAYFFVILMLAT